MYADDTSILVSNDSAQDLATNALNEAVYEAKYT